MDKKTTSNFMDRPRTSQGRWTFSLGLGSLLIVPVLGFLGTLLRLIFDPESVNPNNNSPLRSAGFVSVVFSLILAVSALVTGMRAIRNGERSWAVWAGMLAALLLGGFWVFMIVGELLYPH